MNDALLLPLGKAVFACYDVATKPTWTAESHVYLTEAKDLPGIADGTVIFSYEGTASDRDWLVNFCALPWPIKNHPDVGPVHLGWHDSVMSTFSHLVDYLTSRNWPDFLLCGHSKGGAEAGLAALEFCLLGHPPRVVRLYEQPKFATEVVTQRLASLDLTWTQTYNNYGSDLVTETPGFAPWTHLNRRIQLIVSDELNIADKHRMPAVLQAIQKLN